MNLLTYLFTYLPGLLTGARVEPQSDQHGQPERVDRRRRTGDRRRLRGVVRAPTHYARVRLGRLPGHRRLGPGTQRPTSFCKALRVRPTFRPLGQHFGLDTSERQTFGVSAT